MAILYVPGQVVVLPAPPVVGFWLLVTGFWNDAGVWDDISEWVD